jgi:hypothetical protein
VGEQSIIYHNGTTFKSLAMKTTLMRTYGKIDKNGSRILLGDHLGKLYILVLINDGTNITDMKLELLGEVSFHSFNAHTHSLSLCVFLFFSLCCLVVFCLFYIMINSLSSLSSCEVISSRNKNTFIYFLTCSFVQKFIDFCF